MSNFMSLEIGKKSIMMHQAALAITGHNVANANTPGYTRQIPNIVASKPWHAPMLNTNSKLGQLGTGVDIVRIDRIRDSFLDMQIRNENKTAGYWSMIQGTYSKLEVILNEPSEDGIRAVMDQYWQAWQDLSAHPESEAVRAVLAQRGMAVADVFNHTSRQLKELKQDVNDSVAIKVNEINSIAMQLKDLNKQILAISIAGKQPNDLLDRRDLLLDQLSGLIDINIYEDNKGMVAVQAGGRTLVQGIEMNKLSTIQDNEGMHMVVWEDTGVKANIRSGELRGLLDARGKTLLDQEKMPSEYRELIPDMLARLNSMAKTIIQRTNDLHREGYSLNNKSTLPDGTNFFIEPPEPQDSIVDWAQMMKVESFITMDTKNIAAAGEATWDTAGNKANFGDGSNALRIAQLKHDADNSQLRPASITTKEIDLAALQGDTLSFQIMFSGQIYDISYDVELTDDWSEIKTGLEAAINLIPALNGKFTVELADNGAISSSIVIKSNDNKFQSIYNFSPAGINEAKNYHLMRVKDATVDDFWRAMTASVGVLTQESHRMVSNQKMLLGQLENKKESLSGVSLDEEMTNMIKFQHAYNAAARFITTIDAALDVIVNRMGLVGR